MNENKTLKEYMSHNRLKTGDCVFSYALCYLTKYKFMKVVKSEYNDEEYALLQPIEFKSYEKKTWQVLHGYESAHTWIRANIRYDTRFNVNEIDCLNDAVKTLGKHIESSQWQLDKAKKILLKS